MNIEISNKNFYDFLKNFEKLVKKELIKLESGNIKIKENLTPAQTNYVRNIITFLNILKEDKKFYEINGIGIDQEISNVQKYVGTKPLFIISNEDLKIFKGIYLTMTKQNYFFDYNSLKMVFFDMLKEILQIQLDEIILYKLKQKIQIIYEWKKFDIDDFLYNEKTAPKTIKQHLILFIYLNYILLNYFLFLKKTDYKYVYKFENFIKDRFKKQTTIDLNTLGTNVDWYILLLQKYINKMQLIVEKEFQNIKKETGIDVKKWFFKTLFENITIINKSTINNESIDNKTGLEKKKDNSKRNNTIDDIKRRQEISDKYGKLFE